MCSARNVLFLSMGPCERGRGVSSDFTFREQNPPPRDKTVPRRSDAVLGECSWTGISCWTTAGGPGVRPGPTEPILQAGPEPPVGGGWEKAQETDVSPKLSCLQEKQTKIPCSLVLPKYGESILREKLK